MRTNTDLAGVKSLANTLVMLDIQTTEFSPMIVKHPLIEVGIVAFQPMGQAYRQYDITKDTEALDRWRQIKRKHINESKSVHEIADMLTPSYGYLFLADAAPYLSIEDFSQILSALWIRNDGPTNDTIEGKGKLLPLFRRAKPELLMAKHEYDYLRALEDTVTVYRGVTSQNGQNIKSLSWTLDYDTANWFAHRYGENGTVYKAKIDREHIYAYFNRRKEAEVIVDPKYLMAITEI